MIPLSVVQVLPYVTTPLALVAFLALVLMHVHDRRAQHQENLLNALPSQDRLKAYTLWTRSELSKSKLSAIALMVSFSFVSAYTLGMKSPQKIEIEEINEPAMAPSSLPGIPHPASQDIPPRGKEAPGTKFPFAVRAINASTLDDELLDKADVIVTHSSDLLPRPTTYDGEFFFALIGEADRASIRISATLDNQRLERTVSISGFTLTRMPCDSRTIYLLKKPIELSDRIIDTALRGFGNTIRCPDIDRTLVIWEAIWEISKGVPQGLPQSVKNIGDLIEYNWAKSNSQACISLGYDSQCEIGESAFKNISNISFGSLRIQPGEKRRILDDVKSMPRQISYTRLRRLFATRDFLASAQLAEKLIKDYDKAPGDWERMRISKSRLYADAAVSWSHYSDNLTSVTDPQEKNRRCVALERALTNARYALWFDFRREHVPVLEQKLAGCPH